MLNKTNTDAVEQPDWAALRRDYQVTGLLHLDASMCALAVRAAGMLAYLATPVTDYCDGPVLGADVAEGWQRTVIGLARVLCYSPAVNAQIMAEFAGVEASTCRPKISTELRLMELVVVPPMAGWDTSGEVWRVVRAALDMNVPVYVLAQQAGAA